MPLRSYSAQCFNVSHGLICESIPYSHILSLVAMICSHHVQAAECTIRIEVLDSSLSGGHKVKIQGVVISDVATVRGDLPEERTSILHLMGGALIADRKSLGRRLLRR